MPIGKIAGTGGGLVLAALLSASCETPTLPDGRIGTINAQFAAVTEATWTYVADMGIQRFDAAAATGPDGRIYAIGGRYDYNQFTSTVEAYDPATNTWTAVASLSTVRSGLAAAVGADGRIYALGGICCGGGGSWPPVNTVEVYDPATNTWTAVASMPGARTNLAAVTGHDGLIYAIGGSRWSTSVTVYDPVTNTWSARASMPTGRGQLAAAVAPDGRIYAMGGYRGHWTGVNTVEVYDPATDTWSVAASMPVARLGLAAVTGRDGLIYAIGGNPSRRSRDVAVYDPVTNTWSARAAMQAGRYGLAAAIGHEGRIYAIGGHPGQPFLKSVETYPTVVVVDIDIKPGENPNPINPKSRGSIPVAILGSDVFDVTEVDVTTLAFGPNGALPKHDLTDTAVYAEHLEDVNGDSFTDLAAHYLQKETGLAAGDTEACITATTPAGTPVQGCDVVVVR